MFAERIPFVTNRRPPPHPSPLISPHKDNQTFSRVSFEGQFESHFACVLWRDSTRGLIEWKQRKSAVEKAKELSAMENPWYTHSHTHTNKPSATIWAKENAKRRDRSGKKKKKNQFSPSMHSQLSWTRKNCFPVLFVSWWLVEDDDGHEKDTKLLRRKTKNDKEGRKKNSKTNTTSQLVGGCH